MEAGVRSGNIGAAAPVQDIMLESVIAQEQIEVLYQPLIEPGRKITAPRRLRGR